jgi:hypothetical protein
MVATITFSKWWSNTCTTVATSRAGTAHHSGTPEFKVSYSWQQSLLMFLNALSTILVTVNW